jgi:2-C-methyl-D-erythritol 2,4-cyclodiphosphate synthase
MLRIGQGYDAHKFKDGDHIVIGGVTIPHSQGMAAHSDGDVALHALCDALLGAAALGDIGKHFPDTDASYKGIDSRILLRHVVGKIAELGYRAVNVDVTLVAQAPKMAPHIPTMRQRIAEDLGIGVDAVNVKATTTEGMGFEGRGEGISSHAVALLQKTIIQ